MNDHRTSVHNVKLKPKKTKSLNRIQTSDLCDDDVMNYSTFFHVFIFMKLFSRK